MDKAKPMKPENAPKMIYRVPISLWFVEKNQRSNQAPQENLFNKDTLATEKLEYKTLVVL